MDAPIQTVKRENVPLTRRPIAIGQVEGQFPSNFGQKTRVNAATSNTNVIDHFVLSARASRLAGESGVITDGDNDILSITLVSKGFESFGKGRIPTFMDSGMSNTMFVSLEAFSAYKTNPLHSGESAKASDGNFDIIGEGTLSRKWDREKVVIHPRYSHPNTKCEPCICQWFQLSRLNYNIW
jgi:hypothetical protein